MTAAVDQIARDLEAVRALEAEDLGSLSGAGVVELQAAAGRLKRGVDAYVASVASQVGSRSAPEDGAGGLARKHGFSSPGRMVAKEIGVSFAEAGRMMNVGEALAPPVPAGPSAVAEPPPPPRYPHVSAAIAARDLGLEAASLIKDGLDRIDKHVSAERRDTIEASLVAKAPSLTVTDVRRMVQRIVAQVDAAGQAEREERAYQERFVSMRDEGESVLLTARLDAASAAPLVTAIDVMVGDAFRRRRDQDPQHRDTRSVTQMRADALTTMARHLLGCEGAEQTQAKTTVVVRMSLDDLRSGDGVGEIDGVSQPVSVGRLRQMAADAEVIPAVLGEDGEVLNFGRTRRLFSTAQRRALVERDGGCAWCHAPPSYCEAHHIRWWTDGGTTDLHNGVMMCVSCHHRVHRDRWKISVRHGKVWFTPPREIDPARRPRLGGRAAREVSAGDLGLVRDEGNALGEADEAA